MWSPLWHQNYVVYTQLMFKSLWILATVFTDAKECTNTMKNHRSLPQWFLILRLTCSINMDLHILPIRLQQCLWRRMDYRWIFSTNSNLVPGINECPSTDNGLYVLMSVLSPNLLNPEIATIICVVSAALLRNFALTQSCPHGHVIDLFAQTPIPNLAINYISRPECCLETTASE